MGEAIEAARPFDGGIDGAFEVGGDEDITGNCLAVFAKLVLESLKRLGMPGHEDHAVVLRDEVTGQGGADSAACRR